MRADILAWKENETTAILRVFNNELDAMFFVCLMRMKGYKTRVVYND